MSNRILTAVHLTAIHVIIDKDFLKVAHTVCCQFRFWTYRSQLVAEHANDCTFCIIGFGKTPKIDPPNSLELLDRPAICERFSKQLALNHKTLYVIIRAGTLSR